MVHRTSAGMTAEIVANENANTIKSIWARYRICFLNYIHSLNNWFQFNESIHTHTRIRINQLNRFTKFSYRTLIVSLTFYYTTRWCCCGRCATLPHTHVRSWKQMMRNFSKSFLRILLTFYASWTTFKFFIWLLKLRWKSMNLKYKSEHENSMEFDVYAFADAWTFIVDMCCRAFTENKVVEHRAESVVKRSKLITNSAVAAAEAAANVVIPSYILAYRPKDKFSVRSKVKSRHIWSIAFIRVIKIIIKRMRKIRRRSERKKETFTLTHTYTRESARAPANTITYPN